MNENGHVVLVNFPTKEQQEYVIWHASDTLPEGCCIVWGYVGGYVGWHILQGGWGDNYETFFAGQTVDSAIEAINEWNSEDEDEDEDYEFDQDEVI